MALGSLRGVLFFYERNIEMKDLLISIAQGLVEEPKQGRIAKAIRTVMRAAATRCDEKVAVEID